MYSDDEDEPVYIRPKNTYEGWTDAEIKEYKRNRTHEYNKVAYIKRRRKIDRRKKIEKLYKDLLYIIKHGSKDTDIWNSLKICEEELGVNSGMKLDGYTWCDNKQEYVKDKDPVKSFIYNNDFINNPSSSIVL